MSNLNSKSSLFSLWICTYVNDLMWVFPVRKIDALRRTEGTNSYQCNRRDEGVSDLRSAFISDVWRLQGRVLPLARLPLLHHWKHIYSYLQVIPVELWEQTRSWRQNWVVLFKVVLSEWSDSVLCSANSSCLNRCFLSEVWWMLERKTLQSVKTRPCS